MNVRLGDPDKPPPQETWSGQGRLEDVLPFARRFTVPGVDIEGLVGRRRSSGNIPMCDRDPLPRWTHRPRDAARRRRAPDVSGGLERGEPGHPRRPCLADSLAGADHPRHALAVYEAERLPKTAEICAMNRQGGPERVIDAVEALAPGGFDDVERVLSTRGARRS